METINAMIQKAEATATTANNATGRICSTRRAMSMNITVDGPVVVKPTMIIVPIQIRFLDSFDTVSKKIILDRSTFKVLRRI